MVELVANRFEMMFADMNSFLMLVGRGMVFRRFDRPADKLSLLREGFLSRELFEALVCGGESYNTKPISFIWQRLVDSSIVVDTLGHFPGAFVDHALDHSTLHEHLRGDTFANLFAPPAALASRYAGAIVAVDVEKKGDLSRGSGFLAQASHDHAAWVVTCRHNVDPDQGITLLRITTAAGHLLTTGTPVLSDRYDLAIISLSEDVPGPKFRLSDAVDMFDEVYTLGHPNVPGALPVLMGHRGEVNAVAELYLDKSPAIIISNLVSPGSSGCPVLLRDGRCVGMTIRWLEGKTEDGERTRFSAALPATQIREMLELHGE